MRVTLHSLTHSVTVAVPAFSFERPLKITPDSIPEANSEDGFCFCKLNAFTASRCCTVCVHLVIRGPTAVQVAIYAVQFERICFPIALHCRLYIIMACTRTAQPCLTPLTDLPRPTRFDRIQTAIEPSVVEQNDGLT
jgi:hypothetical protein